MSEPFTMTTTGWELALLAFAFFLAGAQLAYTLCTTRRKIPPRKDEL